MNLRLAGGAKLGESNTLDVKLDLAKDAHAVLRTMPGIETSVLPDLSIVAFRCISGRGGDGDDRTTISLIGAQSGSIAARATNSGDRMICWRGSLKQRLRLTVSSEAR